MIAGQPGWAGHLPVGALRVVRWSNHFEQTVPFYRELVGLQEIDSFQGSYGLDGVILGLPDYAVHLEIVRSTEPAPSNHGLDQLVFYLPDPAAQQRIVHRFAVAGIKPVAQIDYWVDNGGVTFADPDGREVVFASWVYRPA